MKRFLLFLTAFTFLLGGCARFKHKKIAAVPSVSPSPASSSEFSLPTNVPETNIPSSPPTVASSEIAPSATPVFSETATSIPPTATSAPEQAPTPDFASMSFLEKNDLYLRLLDEKRAAGVDTSAAEDAYLQSLKASFSGDSAAADKYLEEAILLLLDS